MPSPWQIFHVSPFLPLCPLPSLSSISVTELPGRRRAAQPPPPPVYEPYTSIYQNPLFSARHGSRRAEEGFDISPIGHTTEKGGILHTYTGWPRPVTCAHFAPPPLSQPISRTYEWRKKANKYAISEFVLLAPRWRRGRHFRQISKKGNFHDCSSPKLQASQFLLFPLSSS